jgi:outer membrane murein-binding lipoprotein Lpp
MAEQVDLNFIARRLDQLGNDVANMRDSITVLTAMVSRLEASVTSLVQEMRAAHRQMARFDNRLRKLETEPTP